MPSPIQNFAGLSFADSCTGGPCGAGWPPDTNGDVGLSHYIVAVNDAYGIYNKTGTLLASFTENQLWSGTPPNLCNGNNHGDPVVLYDQLADRWILTHLAFAVSGGNPVSPFYQCIAASKTSDPVSGGWWLYALRMDPGGAGFPPIGALNDYPKFGIWPDCLYMAANEFQYPGEAFIGTLFASFSRSDLYGGAPLTWALGFINNATGPFTMIPSNLRGRLAAQLPAPGTPNYYVSESTTLFTFEVRKFTAGPNCGGDGTLSAATNVSQTSYTVASDDIVPQPGTAILLDSLPDRLMQKVQYRKVGTAESLWVVHSVQTSSTSTVRPQWAQLDVTGGVIGAAPVQQQIYAPDATLYRWMPSLAVDNQGNMALGYSTSNGTSPNFPSIAYSGRLATDPLNTLPQSEVQLIAGAGSQTHNCGGAACSRWGDYTAMSVDPADDCTFWYTNQYYSSVSNGASGNWQTRIGSFKFSSCTPAVPVFLGGVYVATGKLTGGPARAIITGAGAGGGPHVRAFDAAGTVLPGLEFFAFAPSFPGGVRVASCDVNGDGIDDFIVGAGPGGGPHVRVLSGANSAVELASFFAYSAGFSGGVYVACASVEGSPFQNIVTGADAGGGPHVRVFRYAPGQPGNVLDTGIGFFAFTPGFTGGVRVAACDLTGDGKADLIVGAGPGGGPHVRVLSGANPAVELASFYAYSAGFSGGVYVACGTFPGGPRIVTGAGPGGGPHVRLFTPMGADAGVGFFAYAVGFTGGVRVAVGDVSGDAQADIVTGAGPGGGPHVRAFDANGNPEATSFFAY